MLLITLLTHLVLAFLHVVPGAKASPRNYPDEDVLTPYVGTWVARTSAGEFKLVLQEHKNVHFGPSISLDLIEGGYSYDTGTGIPNESLSQLANNPSMTLGLNDKYPDGIFGSFYDVAHHRSADIKLSFTNADKTQLAWVIVGMREVISIGSVKQTLPGISVPSNLILTKVK